MGMKNRQVGPSCAEMPGWAILCSEDQPDCPVLRGAPVPPGAERFWNKREGNLGGKAYMVPEITPFSRESVANHPWEETSARAQRQIQENWTVCLLGGTSGNLGPYTSMLISHGQHC